MVGIGSLFRPLVVAGSSSISSYGGDSQQCDTILIAEANIIVAPSVNECAVIYWRAAAADAVAERVSRQPES